MNREPVEQGLIIVLVGDLNPSIFQPAWFASQNLIKQSEADGATIGMINAKFVDFATGSFHLTVTDNRLELQTTRVPDYEMVRDLVTSTFKVLRHTPLRMLGINWLYHVKLDSDEQLDSFIQQITPRSIWEDCLESPRMVTVTMQGKTPHRGVNGNLSIRIEPSIRQKPGIFMQITDHFELSDDKKPVIDAVEIADLFSSHWITSQEKAIEYYSSIISNI
jgi:hypothetical protein